MPAALAPVTARELDDLERRYLSTVHTGGTPEQRQFAYDRWSAAEKQYNAQAKAIR